MAIKQNILCENVDVSESDSLYNQKKYKLIKNVKFLYRLIKNINMLIYVQ